MYTLEYEECPEEEASQSLPIQVINSDIPQTSRVQNGPGWSQSLPIQVINSDSTDQEAGADLPWDVTIPSNSGHKF